MNNGTEEKQTGMIPKDWKDNPVLASKVGYLGTEPLFGNNYNWSHLPARQRPVAASYRVQGKPSISRFKEIGSRVAVDHPKEVPHALKDWEHPPPAELAPPRNEFISGSHDPHGYHSTSRDDPSRLLDVHGRSKILSSGFNTIGSKFRSEEQFPDAPVCYEDMLLNKYLDQPNFSMRYNYGGLSGYYSQENDLSRVQGLSKGYKSTSEDRFYLGKENQQTFQYLVGQPPLNSVYSTDQGRGWTNNASARAYSKVAPSPGSNLNFGDTWSGRTEGFSVRHHNNLHVHAPINSIREKCQPIHTDSRQFSADNFHERPWQSTSQQSQGIASNRVYRDYTIHETCKTQAPSAIERYSENGQRTASLSSPRHDILGSKENPQPIAEGVPKYPFSAGLERQGSTVSPQAGASGFAGFHPSDRYAVHNSKGTIVNPHFVAASLHGYPPSNRHAVTNNSGYLLNPLTGAIDPLRHPVSDRHNVLNTHKSGVNPQPGGGGLPRYPSSERHFLKSHEPINNTRFGASNPAGYPPLNTHAGQNSYRFMLNPTAAAVGPLSGRFTAPNNDRTVANLQSKAAGLPENPSNRRPVPDNFGTLANLPPGYPSEYKQLPAWRPYNADRQMGGGNREEGGRGDLK